MKYLVSLFLLVQICQPLYSNSYIDFLDAIVDQKVTELANSSYNVEKFVKKIQKNIKTEISLQEIEEFLDHENSVAFFFCDQMQAKIDEMAPDGMTQAQQSFKDLQFVLGAKLYVYYLECAKQKMLYKAVKNYDALNFWRNEKFWEAQSFFQKNILRSLSTSDYKKRVEENIKQLEDLTNQTNAFLGLILHNQQLLQQAMTQQEFQQNLVQAVQLQDEFLHIPHQYYEACDVSLIIKKSIDQVSRLSVHLSAQYAQCKYPSHIVRHWEGYTLTTAVACVGAFIYMRYGDEIGLKSQYIWDEHIHGPFDKSWKAICGLGTPPALDVQATKDSLRVSEEAALARPEPMGDETPIHEAINRNINEMTNGKAPELYKAIKDRVAIVDNIIIEVDTLIDEVKPVVKDVIEVSETVREFVHEHKDATILNPFPHDGVVAAAQKRYNVLSEQHLKPLDNMFQNNPLTPVNKEEKVIQLQESLDNLIPTDFIEPLRSNAQSAIDISALSPEQRSQLQKQRDDIILANGLKNWNDAGGAGIRLGLRKVIDGETQINEQLKNIHVYTTLGALTPALTLIGASLFASKSLYKSMAYQPIRTLVRRLEALLNDILYQPISFEKEGHLYFLTEQLKLNVNVLTIAEQKMIDIDITALQSHSLDYAQKFNVIQRMYHTYPCLVPGTV